MAPEATFGKCAKPRCLFQALRPETIAFGRGAYVRVYFLYSKDLF